MARLYILQLIAGIIGGVIAAKKGRGILVWFLLCGILPLFTIVILILPSLKTDSAARRCPNCSRPIDNHDDRCRFCNEQKPIELVQCNSCGSFVSEHENCPNCSQEGKRKD